MALLLLLGVSTASSNGTNISAAVTANRQEQKITTVLHETTALAAEDIRRSGTRTIPNALHLSLAIHIARLSFRNAAIPVISTTETLLDQAGTKGFLASSLCTKPKSGVCWI